MLRAASIEEVPPLDEWRKTSPELAAAKGGKKIKQQAAKVLKAFSNERAAEIEKKGGAPVDRKAFAETVRKGNIPADLILYPEDGGEVRAGDLFADPCEMARGPLRRSIRPRLCGWRPPHRYRLFGLAALHRFSCTWQTALCAGSAPGRCASAGPQGGPESGADRSGRFRATVTHKAEITRLVPVIKITGGSLSDNADAAERILRAANVAIYHQGGRLVRPLRGKLRDSKGKEVQVTAIAEVTSPMLRDELCRHAEWQRWDKRIKEWQRADPSKDIADTVLSRKGEGPHWRTSGGCHGHAILAA